MKAEVLRRLAQAVAATDPDHAERIADSISVELDKIGALADIARALA